MGTGQLPAFLRTLLRPRMGKDSAPRRLLWGALFVLCLFVLISGYFLNQTVSLGVGDIAPADIIAPRRVLNLPIMHAEQQQAAASVPPVYYTDANALPAMQATLAAQIKALQRLRQEVTTGTQTLTGAESGFAQTVGVFLSHPVVSALLTAPQGEGTLLLSQGSSVLSSVMGAGYTQSQMARAAQEVQLAVDGLYLPSRAQQVFLRTAITQDLRPTLVYSAKETARRRQAAMAAVTPRYVDPGEIIVARGSKVTADQVALLRELGLLRQASVPALAGSFGLSVLLVSLMVLYLQRFQRDVVRSETRGVLLGSIALITLAVAKVLLPVSPFMMPLGAATMLLALLMNGPLAIFVGMVLAATLGEVASYTPAQSLALLLGAVTGVLWLSRPKRVGIHGGADFVGQRSRLMGAGAAIAVVNALSVGILTLLGLTGADHPLWENVAFGTVGGLLSSMITIGALPFFETFFGILTPLKLMELSNLNQPLLRRLLMEAPGTYHHSMMVAQLSEAAAEAVGGDGLLARVGSYYHDIGKIKRPYFFIDNQFGMENPHNRISPTLSTLIITAHVKDGLEMAREAHLPPEVIRFVNEHHGTTLVRYFYSRAAEDGTLSNMTEEDFRYEGPKPQSKETAIVMLADTAEAAVRALPNPTAGKIEGLVRKLIRDKLYDGQMDESDLTLRDLDTIAKTFTTVLAGVFHQRIAYPQPLKEAQKGVAAALEGGGKSGGGAVQ